MILNAQAGIMPDGKNQRRFAESSFCTTRAHKTYIPTYSTLLNKATPMTRASIHSTSNVSRDR